MLQRAFGQLAFLTLLSRLSGFARVAIFASFFGSSPESDVFLTALLVPELMYRFLSEGLVSSAAIPIFVRLRERPDELQGAFWSIFWTVTAVAGLGVVGLILFAEPICGLLVPGFSPVHLRTLADLWRSIAPYVLLSAQAAVMSAFLNARNIFARPGLGPLLVNGTIIASILFTHGGNLEAIALSVTLGALIQLAWMGWLIRANGLAIDGAFSRQAFSWPVIGEFSANVAPIALWIFLTPIIPVYERYLLSSEAVGSVSLLNYNEKLINLPLGIISISLATVLFPSLSGAPADRRSPLLGAGLWALAALLVPVFLIIQGGSETIVGVVFQRGRFHLAETGLTAEFFRNYAWALMPTSICLLLNRAFFARGNFRLPFFAGLSGIIVNILVDALLVPKWGPTSVGWGAGLAATFQMGLLFLGLLWTTGTEALRWAVPPALGAILAGLLLYRPVAAALNELNGRFGAGGKWEELLILTAVGFLLQLVIGLIARFFWRRAKAA